MMTPAQLKSYEFKTAGRNAYKADDVDEFLAEVVINYEKMFRENSELIKRVSLLADKIESYKSDEADIKQAVIGAQKAADMIIKEAEESVEDIKAEADAILAAAKGEADVIKSDAEKQAIADSELVLAIATDKAEDIIAKAKEKAHGILIAANDSASNTMGQANRTITSESLHYDMLKKEVSEFRASILAQYKAHIEMISKLPEIAVEEASKIENVELPQTSVEELEAEIESNDAVVDSYDSEDAVLEFVPAEEIPEDSDDNYIEVESDEEKVVKTTLPYDFFEENSTLEFVDNEQEQDAPVSELDAFENTVGIEFDEENKESIADIPVSKNFTVDTQDIDFSLFEEESDEDISNDIAEIPSHIVVDDDEDDETDDFDESGFFDSIETIDPFVDEEEEPKRKGFFRRKK